MKDEAREKLEYDVFLSHNSQDKPVVYERTVIEGGSG
jgi:hypothetical protein